MSNTVPEKWCLIIDGVFVSPFLSIDFHLNWVPVQQMPLSQVIQSNKIHTLTHKGDSLGNNPFWFRDDKILLISSFWPSCNNVFTRQGTTYVIFFFSDWRTKSSKSLSRQTIQSQIFQALSEVQEWSSLIASLATKIHVAPKNF